MTCFYTCYNHVFENTANNLERSVKRFYPDIDFIKCELPEDVPFDLKKFCDFHMLKGKELLEKYDRVISVDTDSLMVAPCPDFFDEYDLGVVQNNIPNANLKDGTDNGIYINAGLDICNNKEVWQEYYDEYNKRAMDKWDPLAEQNALNYIYHTSKKNCKLLEFEDRVYGPSVLFGYNDLKFKDGNFYVPGVFDHKPVIKKVCMMHFCGEEWKDKKNGAINYSLVEDPIAREELKKLC